MKPKTFELDINGHNYTVTINEFTAHEAVLTVNDQKYRVGLKDLGLEQIADIKPKSAPVVESKISGAPVPSTALHRPKAVLDSAAIIAPLPGLIQHVSVRVGDQVKAGQQVITMEAMKMENEIQSGRDGVVKEVKVQVGDSVNEGDVLIVLE